MSKFISTASNHLTSSATHVTQQESQPNKRGSLSDVLHSTTCPACAHHVAVSFYDGGHHPLSIMAWPKSTPEAQKMERLPLDFVRCVDCGHVYNAQFTYDKVPYSEKPNLMFNNGAIWGEHLKNIRDRLLACLPENPVVVEIGCGDGHLLRSLADARPSGRYIGFDPSGTLISDRENIEAHAALFDPAIHLAEYKPDLLISRHVMEHLTNPLAFLQSIAFAVTWEGLETSLFIEVPCVDRTFQSGRTTDFFYEHNSHFTTTSLTRFLSRCSNQVEWVDRGYGDEVVYGLARLGTRVDQLAFAREAIRFKQTADTTRKVIQEQLDEVARSGKTIAVWGGTGKASTFINRYNIDKERFPVVVDSDPDKEGTFVPGMGQKILLSDTLKENPAQTIVVTTQWRARDIYLEIEHKGIPFETILIEHNGKLINFLTDPHPYHNEGKYLSKPKKLKGASAQRAIIAKTMNP